MERERCRLAGTVFLGAIIVTNGSKSEKKAHKKKHETNGCTKNCLEGIIVRRGY